MTDPTATASTTTSTTIAVVSMELPPFWPQDPEVWFAQVEVQFATRDVTAQRTKFDYVVSSFAMEICDLLLKPPEEDPYNTIKT